MAKNDWLLGNSPNPLGDRIDEIREKLKDRNPENLAERTGAIYSGDNFRLPFWSRDVVVSFPDFIGKYAHTGEELNTFDMTMLAYYFETSDNVPLSGEWISFNQIPEGMFYAQAFQNYSGNKLLDSFGDDIDAFIAANEKIGGRRELFGKVAFSYQILPHIPMMVVCWLGDDDFLSSYRILFDSTAHHHLVVDGYAILGGNLARKLIGAKG